MEEGEFAVDIPDIGFEEGTRFTGRPELAAPLEAVLEPRTLGLHRPVADGDAFGGGLVVGHVPFVLPEVGGFAEDGGGCGGLGVGEGLFGGGEGVGEGAVAFLPDAIEAN